MRLLLLALLLTLPQASAGYFPQGGEWVYSSGETQTLTPTQPAGTFTRQHRLGKAVLTEEVLELRSGQLYLSGMRVGGKLSRYQPPLLLYPAPLLPGQSWKSRAGGVTLTGTVLETQPLKLTAGKFNALVVQIDVQQGKAISRQLQYLVPGLGVVRYQDSSGKVTDLVKYTLR